MLLYYITDGSGRTFRISWLLEKIRWAAEQGVDLVQIREKDLSGRELYELTRAAVTLVRQMSGHATRILVNDRADVALAAGADGVHLPSSAMPVARLRPWVPASFLIARSCHDAAEVLQAAREGASFCVFGPVFPTPSKAGMGQPLGLDGLDSIREAPIPVLALGGIELGNAFGCIEHGAAGIAAIRLFQEPPCPDVVQRLRAGAR